MLDMNPLFHNTAHYIMAYEYYAPRILFSTSQYPLRISG